MIVLFMEARDLECARSAHNFRSITIPRALYRISKAGNVLNVIEYCRRLFTNAKFVINLLQTNLAVRMVQNESLGVV